MQRLHQSRNSIKPTSFLGKMATSLKSMEIFGQNFEMKIKDDRNEQNSWVGFCFTILLTLIMSVFCYAKVLVLIEKKDVDVRSVLVESYLDQTYKFDAD